MGQDLDFGNRQITVRSGKGDKDRPTLMPDRLVVPLGAHLEGVRQVHVADITAGWGRVILPHALEHKYPNAAAGGIQPLAGKAGITLMHRSCRKRCARRCRPRGSPNG